MPDHGYPHVGNDPNMRSSVINGLVEHGLVVPLTACALDGARVGRVISLVRHVFEVGICVLGI